MQTDASNVTLPNLFANKFFRIPSYQRGYAWGNTQLTDLWEDILDIKKVNGTYRPHFTGAITLQKKDVIDLTDSEKKLLSNGEEFFDVVDGQQRLTSLSILLFELLKKVKTGKNDLVKTYLYQNSKGVKVYRFSYCDNGNNNNYLLSHIFEECALPSKENIYTKNLLNAKTFFSKKISELHSSQIKELKEKILTALVFDTKYISDNLDVQAVFETMNNRGKPLTTLEKLKNRLLYLTSKLDPSSDITGLSKTINESWGIIYETLGKNSDVLLSEDEFLSAYLTLIRVPADYSFSESASETKIFQMFCSHSSRFDLSMARQHDTTKKEPEVDYHKIHKFVVDIANFASSWYDVCLPDTNFPRGLQVYKIQLLNGSKEMRIFLAQLLNMSKKNATDVDICLDWLLRITFRDSLPGVSLMDERTLANRARELHTEILKINDIKEDFHKRLMTKISAQSIINSVRYLYSYVRGGIGFYRWWALKFFLMEYEKHLQGKKLDHVTWNQYEQNSIEHIIPQKWDTHWSNEVNAYLINKQESLTPEEYEKAPSIIINSLGNLTVIQDIKNPGIGNNCWKDKKAAYANGCFSESEINTTTDWHPWDAKSIRLRGIKMLKFLCDYLEFEQFRPLILTKEEYIDMLLMDQKFI